MKKIKKILFVTIIVSLLTCGSSFSAVVSDNDPDAFITRAEFEAMITTINEKMATYYSTIDNSIDVAITTYISGFAGDDIQNGNKIKY